MGMARIAIPMNCSICSNLCADLILIYIVALSNLGCCLKYEIVLLTHKTAEWTFAAETNVTARECVVMVF